MELYFDRAHNSANAQFGFANVTLHPTARCRSPIYKISHYHRSRLAERRRVMLWHIGHSLVSVSPHICVTHIRGSGQFSGLSLPAGRKTHLDPSWVTPLRPWPSFLDKLTTIISPSLFVSPIRSLVLARANPSAILIAFLSLGGESTCRILFSFGFSSRTHREHLPFRGAALQGYLQIDLISKRFFLRLAWNFSWQSSFLKN